MISLKDKNDMDNIVKNIDDIFEELKICAYGRTLPSGRDTGCLPSFFAANAKKFFAEIDKLNEKSPNIWKGNEYQDIFDCERLSRYDLAIASGKNCKNSEAIVLKYLDKFTEIVDIIHCNL